MQEDSQNLLANKCLELGFKDVSYPKLESQTSLFQLITNDTNLLVNLSFPNKIIVEDGRATIQKVYHEDEILPDSLDAIKQNFGNLKTIY